MLRATSAVCPHVRRPPFRLRSCAPLLLVRLHLPPFSRFCNCGELLDVCGHHRSAPLSLLTGRGLARGCRQGQAIHEAEQPEVPRVAYAIPSVARTVEPHRRHVLEEFGLAQVSFRAQSPSPFNPSPVLPALGRFVGLLRTAGVRCQLAGEASGHVRVCEHGPAVPIWTAFHCG